MLSELQSLTGVGPKVEDALNRLGLYSFEIFYFIYQRYEDRTTRIEVANLKPGIPQLLEGEITSHL